MLGLNVKRGVESTLERVFKASGNTFGSLEFRWSGRTAGIIHKPENTILVFPSIDEGAQIDQVIFNNLIGYAMHELGHAWYTSNEPWDRARENEPLFVGSLINGLEDPRIENCVINSGFAPNAKALFGNLVNDILRRDGYVRPDDKKNIPFLLAIEGRRLNGYAIEAPSIVEDSPYAEHLTWALSKAHVATSTDEIVKIAIELFKRLKDQDKVSESKPESKPESGESGEQPEESTEGNGEPDENVIDNDDMTEAILKDAEHDRSFERGRDVEPTQFIKDVMFEHQLVIDSDKWDKRPSIAKPVTAKIEWK